MFEKASRLKLRFNSVKGSLDIEDLWELNLQALNQLAKRYSKIIKESNEEDFLEDLSKEDEILILKFDIVLHILKTKKTELEEAKNSNLRKQEREKILNVLSKKADDALENLSEAALKKKLEELK